MNSARETVLLIEDSESTRFVYREFLEENGYHVLEAEDGYSGLDLIHAHSPDIVILDLILPDIHGLEVLKQIRLDENTRDLPVLVLTSVKETENMQKTMNLGANYYAHKDDFTPEKTLEIIPELLKKKK